MTIDIEERKIRKRFGFLDLLLSAIGSTIGAGVFILLPIGINIAGLGIILSILLASVITIIVALNYGELAAALPFEGGGYSWAKMILWEVSFPNALLDT